MKIEVSKIREDEGLKIDHVFREGEPQLRSRDSQVTGQPALNAFAMRKGSEVRICGTLKAIVQVDCARCLSSIPISVDEVFDLLYIPSVDPSATKEEKELAEEDLLVAFYRGDLIDLDDVAREQLELALPMARLCKEECRGLCPDCGANLNQRQCGCTNEAGDLRWSALKQWKTES